jgi:hypothetical protein
MSKIDKEDEEIYIYGAFHLYRVLGKCPAKL